MKGIGVCYVALGHKAREECRLSRETLPDAWPVEVFDKVDETSTLTIEQQAHLAKTRVPKWSPFRYTLLLDADTRVVGDLSLGFKALLSGWEVLMVPSIPPSSDKVLWHLTQSEKEYTLETLGTWNHVMLNTGVLFFSRTPPVGMLFEAWEAEWRIFKDKDQGAFLRALKSNPVLMFLLGSDYNSAEGSIVRHLFGRAR